MAMNISATIICGILSSHYYHERTFKFSVLKHIVKLFGLCQPFHVSIIYGIAIIIGSSIILSYLNNRDWKVVNNESK